MSLILSGSAGVTSPGGDTGAADFTINGLTVGKGGGSVSTNTVAGVNALSANTTATQNTALGYTALVNSTGASNTAIGAVALQSNTTGTQNTAVGSGVTATYAGALGNNTTGSYNTAMGVAALALNTTASNNTAVGYQAGYSNTQSNQTFIGYQSGYNTTSGDSNVALGYQTLYSNTTGVNNTAIGYRAGYSLTTGSSNVFLGSRSVTNGNISGYSVTTGGANVIVGNYPGGGAPISATGSNYIVLSDGDGNVRGYFDNVGHFWLNTQGNSFPTYTAQQYIYNSASYNCSIYSLANGTGGQSHILFANPNGLVGQISTSGTTTTYSTSSDYRLKENVQPMTGALDTVVKLKPCTYDWIATKEKGQGFIAHELAEVVPDCVVGEKDAINDDGTPHYQSIDTSFLVATLTAAIQELKAEFDAYKASHP